MFGMIVGAFLFLFQFPQVQPNENGKVLLGFYGESLCPDCINFSNGPLTRAFSEIPTIFTLNFIPWGNAKLTSSGEFECQHGEMECIMNTVEACALYYYPNILELNYANMTSALQPPHRYTPWITINGKHEPKAEGDGLIQVLCDAFLGPNKPEACDNYSNS